MTDKLTAKETLLLYAIFAGALVLRIAFILYVNGNYYFPDSNQYMIYARNLVSGLGYNTLPDTAWFALRTPGYSLLIALVYKVFGAGNFSNFLVVLIQAVLSSLTCVYIFLIGNKIAGRAVGYLSGLFYAVYPFSVFYSAYILSETLAIFLFVICVWFLINITERRGYVYAVLAGLSFGYLHLVKTSVFPLILALGILLIVADLKRIGGNVLRFVVMFVAVMAIVAPWAIRNYTVFGKFISSSTMGGFVLYSGNNPKNVTGGGIYPDDLDYPADIKTKYAEQLKLSSEYFLSENKDRTSLRKIAEIELEIDNMYKQKAVDFIKKNPGRFISFGFKKFGRLWRVTPYASDYSSAKYKIISILSYGVLIPFFLIGIVLAIIKWKVWYAIILPILYITAVHCVFIGSVRYREPVMPFFIIISCFGVHWLFMNIFERTKIPLRPSLLKGEYKGDLS